MFMLKSTHEREMEAHRDATALIINRYVTAYDRLLEQLRDSHDRHAQTERNACDLASECNRLTKLLEERQVPAVRGSRGRFVKREG